MVIFATVLLIISVLFVLFAVTMAIKNLVTYRNHTIIADAIFDYHMDAIDKAYKNGTIMYGVNYKVGYANF